MAPPSASATPPPTIMPIRKVPVATPRRRMGKLVGDDRHGRRSERRLSHSHEGARDEQAAERLRVTTSQCRETPDRDAGRRSPTVAWQDVRRAAESDPGDGVDDGEGGALVAGRSGRRWRGDRRGSDRQAGSGSADRCRTGWRRCRRRRRPTRRGRPAATALRRPARSERLRRRSCVEPNSLPGYDLA